MFTWRRRMIGDRMRRSLGSREGSWSIRILYGRAAATYRLLAKQYLENGNREMCQLLPPGLVCTISETNWHISLLPFSRYCFANSRYVAAARPYRILMLQLPSREPNERRIRSASTSSAR